MNKKSLLYLSTFILLGLMMFSSSMPVAAVEYPYGLSTGDKTTYNVQTLKNGTNDDWLWVQSINLSTGDDFDLEIFDRPANPTNPFGSGFELRMVKGDQVSDTFPGNSMVFTNNQSYWEDSSTNSTFDIGGTIFSFQYEGEIATWSWTTDADNLVKVTFSIVDGLLQSFERKTEDFNAWNYTHFKFVLGSGSSIPGMELPITIVGIFFVAMVVKTQRKRI